MKRAASTSTVTVRGLAHRRSVISAALLVTLALGAPTARAQIGSRLSVPVPLPDRPFLLVDAPRRFSPNEPARVRVQLRDGGRAQVALFRVDDMDATLGLAGRRQGMTVASRPLGHEAEALLAQTGPVPRRGRTITLIARTDVEMPRPEGPRRVWDETTVYDSNEDVEDGVATYWVRGDRWSVREIDVGRLPAGLYLAQVRAGAWVGSALLSVGDIVMIVRRGDAGDVVRVTDPDGAPVRASVTAQHGGRSTGGWTDGDGLVRFAPSRAPSVRYVARIGSDVAWTDVAHVRLPRCDPRVHLATGRPLYRRSEHVFVRGHVRGCDAQGRYLGLAGRSLRVEGGGESVEVTTDADGNFTARVKPGRIRAVLDGRSFERTVRIDDRQLPQRDLIVSVDRPWAATGDTLRVEVADVDGGWPHAADVVLDTPVGRLVGRVLPRAPAVFHVTVPSTDAPLERMAMHASLVEPGRVTMASAEVWIGRGAEHLVIEADGDRGAPDRPFALRVRAQRLDGAPAAGPVALSVHGSDGNRPIGPARHRVQVDVDGAADLEVPLPGDGPWMLVARRGASVAQRVVWSRARPPSLSARGELAIVAQRERVRVGDTLEVAVRTPPGRGRAWVTLEQSGVVASAPARDGTARLSVPDAARGRASLVVAHVEGGRVRTATSTVEVETSLPMHVSVSTDRPFYGRAEHARVTVRGVTDGGRPRDGVISLWLADAGYWGLGEDDYPLPTEHLRLPGRSASGGDSTTSIAYGAEEGRVLDSELVWDGQRLPRTSHRHAWGFGGEVIHRHRARGTLAEVLGSFGRAAGFADVDVRGCDDARHRLRSQDLPWDLVAMRVAEAIDAQVSVAEDTLVFDCEGHGFGGMGMAGRGAGGLPRIRTGNAGIGTIRDERLEGTLHFVDLARLGPDGEIELDVPLPDHPGRWRIEVLAIADDGGGSRGHAVVHTRQALETWVDVARAMRPDDTVRGELVVVGHAMAAAEVDVGLAVTGAALAAGMPTRVRLDESGRARVAFTLHATGEGAVDLEATVRAGGASDRVRAGLTVMASASEQPLRAVALIGPDATEIDVPLPELAAPATVEVVLPSSVEGEVTRVLDALRWPRWDTPWVRVSRLASLAALRRALEGRHSGDAQLLRAEIVPAIQGELTHLAAAPLDGTGIDTAETAIAIEALLAADQVGPDWDDSVTAIRDRLGDGSLHGTTAAMAILFFASSGDASLTRAIERTRRECGDDPVCLTWVVRASGALGAHATSRAASGALARWIDRAVARPAPRPCRTPLWWLCHSGRGHRGVMARAALTLLESGRRPHGRRLAGRAAAWIAAQPARSHPWIWGTDEADVVELIAALDAPAGADRPHVFLDGRRVAATHGRVRVPAGQHRLTLRFAERPGRIRRVEAIGTLALAAPTNALGDANLERRFERGPAGWSASVRFDLAEPAHEATLRVPIPAGLTVDHRALGRSGHAVVDGAVVFELSGLRAGEHTVRVPLLPAGHGRFEAGPAQLLVDRGAAWGVTPATHLDL